MKFWEAMKALEEGKKFRRLNWGDPHGIEASELGDLFWTKDGKMFSLTLEDLEATDWVEVKDSFENVIDEIIETHKDAIERLKD